MPAPALRPDLRRGFIVAIAALGLLLASGMWSGHGHLRSHQHDHCELCLHLGGTAPSPSAAMPGRAPALDLHFGGLPADHPHLPLQTSPAHRPRGPPALDPSA